MDFFTKLLNSRLGYLLEILPFVFIVGAAYEITRGIKLRRHGLGRDNPWRGAVRLLCALYFAGLFALLWVPAGFWSQLPQWLRYGWPVSCLGQMFTGVYNFDVQVLDIINRSSAGSFTLFMLIGNVLMFIPLGLLLPLRWPKLGLVGTMAVGFAADILIELLQPIVGRAFDVDDIICNTLGIAGGALIYLLLRGLFPKTIRKCKGDMENGKA